MPAHIAIVSAEPEYWETLSAILSDCGLRTTRCETLEAATKLFSQQHFDVAVCEDALPDGDFRKLIAEMRRSRMWAPVVVVSRFDDWGSYLDAMIAGAFDYVAFPPYPREFERAVAAALAEARSNRKAAVRAAA
ncbi:MAG TPA: response regulator [Candidatus Acidoferrum sp.]|nr:response regulator [Candidatus Acidoferrum sp.]